MDDRVDAVVLRRVRVARRAVRETERRELGDAPGRERLAAHPVAERALAFDDENARAALGHPLRDRRAADAAADGDDVVAGHLALLSRRTTATKWRRLRSAGDAAKRAGPVIRTVQTWSAAAWAVLAGLQPSLRPASGRDQAADDVRARRRAVAGRNGLRGNGARGLRGADRGRRWRRLTRAPRPERIRALAADRAGGIYASDADGRSSTAATAAT
jgi:hypothetical protein